MTKFYIGIDPGIKGAIAVCDGTRIVAIHDMPVLSTEQASGKTLNRIDAVRLMGILASYEADVIALERVHARPGEGVTSSFNFGHSFGVTETCAALTGSDVRLVLPQTWKKPMGLNGDKNASRALATSLSGDPLPFKRKKDDGRAEAYLLAQWARNV